MSENSDNTSQSGPEDKLNPENADLAGIQGDDVAQRTPAIPQADFDQLRAVALEGYEDSGEDEGETKKVRRGMFEGFSPREKALTIALIFVAAFLVLGSGGYYAYRTYWMPAPATVIPPTSEYAPIPIPAKLVLPGGWDFELASAKIKNGEWTPEGPEWLNGTELRRGISLPWSRQLEVVAKSLQPGDEIQLVMSNVDTLSYAFQSLKEIPVDSLDILKENTPALIIIVSKPDAESRLVIFSVPVSKTQTPEPGNQTPTP